MSRDRYINPDTKDYEGTLRSVTQWDVFPATWDAGLSVWDNGATVFDSGSEWDDGDTEWDIFPAGPLMTETCDTRLYLALGTEYKNFLLNQALGTKLAGQRLKQLAQSEQAIRAEVLRTLKKDMEAGLILDVTVNVSFPQRGWVFFEVECTDGLTGRPVVLALNRKL